MAQEQVARSVLVPVGSTPDQPQVVARFVVSTIAHTLVKATWWGKEGARSSGIAKESSRKEARRTDRPRRTTRLHPIRAAAKASLHDIKGAADALPDLTPREPGLEARGPLGSDLVPGPLGSDLARWGHGPLGSDLVPGPLGSDLVPGPLRRQPPRRPPRLRAPAHPARPSRLQRRQARDGPPPRSGPLLALSQARRARGAALLNRFLRVRLAHSQNPGVQRCASCTPRRTRRRWDVGRVRHRRC
jgi:hypothetical protein